MTTPNCTATRNHPLRKSLLLLCSVTALLLLPVAVGPLPGPLPHLLGNPAAQALTYVCLIEERRRVCRPRSRHAC